MIEEIELAVDWWKRHKKEFEERGHTPKEIATAAYVAGYRKAKYTLPKPTGDSAND